MASHEAQSTVHAFRPKFPEFSYKYLIGALHKINLLMAARARKHIHLTMETTFGLGWMSNPLN